MNKIFLKKKGVVSVEWSIVAPFIFLLTFFTIMFSIFCLNYYALSHTAFSIAQNLNMGDEGYESAAYKGMSYYNSSISNKQWMSNNHGKDSWEDVWDPDSGNYGMFVPSDPKYINIDLNFTGSHLDVFELAARSFIFEKASRGSLNVPYTTIEKINVGTYYGTSGGKAIARNSFSTDKGETESGNIVIVDIKYNFLKFFKVTVRGYTFIV